MKAPLRIITSILGLLVFSWHMATAVPIVRFVENKGQLSDQNLRPRPDIFFVAASRQASCYFRKDGYSVQLFRKAGKRIAMNPLQRGLPEADRERLLSVYRIDIQWLGADENLQIAGEQEQPGYENFYLAACPDGVTGVKNYASITYKQIYPGISMRWKGEGDQLKYEFNLAPGADYRLIRWKISGATAITVDSKGRLLIQTPFGTLSEEAPVSFQDGKILPSAWKITGDEISFEVKNVHREKELVIDPLLRIWGSYYGGPDDEAPGYTTLDNQGNLYVSGITSSQVNIATTGSHQSTFGAGPNLLVGDAMLIKMSPAGVRLWATYFGGTSYDYGNECVCNASGDVYLIGGSTSTNAGVISTPGCFQPSLNATGTGTAADVFIAKFTGSGTRVWSTYYGDNDEDWGYSIDVDQNGDLYISGGTYMTTSAGTVFGTPGSHQPVQAGAPGFADAFLAKFTPQGNRIWSTYYGGTGWDNGHHCAADTLGNVYLTGVTSSTNALAISTPGMFQMNFAGGSIGTDDAFIAKFTGSGTRLWGTYYGGLMNDLITTCQVDKHDNLVVFGTTASFNSTLFASPGAHQVSYGGGNSECFVARFSPSGTRRWGTYYGGSGYEEMGQCCVSKSGSIFFCGRTSVGSGTAIVSCGAYQQQHGGGVNDNFFVHFDSLGVRRWGSFFGGTGNEFEWCMVSADAGNNLYLAGCANATSAASVFATSGAHQLSYAGGPYDLYIEKFDACIVQSPTLVSGYNACIGQKSVLKVNQTCGMFWYNDAGLSNLVYSGGSFTTNVLFGDTTFYVVDESCGILSPPAVVQLTAGISPTVNIVSSALSLCEGSLLELYPTGASSYTWSGYASQYSLALTPSVSSSFTVTGAYANGCLSTATIGVVVETCAGLHKSGGALPLLCYPNPASESVAFRFQGPASLRLYNAAGELLLEHKEFNPDSTLDVSGLEAGFYLLKLDLSENSQTFRILVNH